MAKPIPHTELLKALIREGCRVAEVGGWQTRHRNHKGPWGPIHGVMVHHTVTSGTQKTVDLCRDGHRDLPGPLCHAVIGKDGRVYLISNGRANHAGLGDGDVLKAVVAEKTLPADNQADTDGNAHFYGFECENLGDGRDPWPVVQTEAIVRACAAVCRYYGWTERSVIRHLDWQPGKVDPRGLDWRGIHRRIGERLKHPASWSPGAAPRPAPAPVPSQPERLTLESLDRRLRALESKIK